jgi:hypothetical protein
VVEGVLNAEHNDSPVAEAEEEVLNETSATETTDLCLTVEY